MDEILHTIQTFVEQKLDLLITCLIAPLFVFFITRRLTRNHEQMREIQEKKDQVEKMENILCELEKNRTFFESDRDNFGLLQVPEGGFNITPYIDLADIASRPPLNQYFLQSIIQLIRDTEAGIIWVNKHSKNNSDYIRPTLERVREPFEKNKEVIRQVANILEDIKKEINADSIFSIKNNSIAFFIIAIFLAFLAGYFTHFMQTQVPGPSELPPAQ